MYQNKVVYSFIVAVCLLCSFSACSNGDPYVPLTETEMHQISRDWEMFNNTPLAWQYQDLDHYALFYGRYNGSIVLLISGEHIEIMPIFKHDIAGYTFEYSKPFALYAYCEGVLRPWKKRMTMALLRKHTFLKYANITKRKGLTTEIIMKTRRGYEKNTIAL